MRASEIQPKKLVVFDIDDTLVHTQTKVHVVKDGEVVKSLNSHDFTHYKLQPGESFDFEDFRNAREFFEKSKPIIPMMDQLRRDIATGNKVVMVTARADFDDKELFLDTFRKYGIDMNKVHVYRAGNSKQGTTEERKKAIIKTLLDKDDYTKAIMYDDAKPNLHTFMELKKDHPQTRFYAWHVSLDGEASEYMREELVSEKKKKRRKNKSRRVYGAVWGPGPYGLYGWDAGYSGAGGVSSGDGGGVGEASYPGNLGAMELVKFFQKAGPEEKKILQQLINKKDYKRAWAMIQGLTGVKLQGHEFENIDEGWKEKLAALGIAGTLGLSSASGAEPKTNPVQDKIIATIVIDGETKRLDLTPKGFDDVRDAEKWLDKFMRDRGIMNWQGKIEKGQPGSGQYQRVRIMGAGGLESINNEGWRDTLAGLALGAGVAMSGPAAANVEKVQVGQGDTVFSIAKAFGTTPQTIQKLNKLDKNFSIKAGQTLKVPAGEVVDVIKEPSKTKAEPPKKKPAKIDTSKTLTGTTHEAVLTRTARASGITDPTELAAFLAQCAHESHDFKSMVEYGGSLDFRKYDPKFAPKKARALGNTKVGDGARYKGRGYIQLTGRYNYKRAGEALGLPLEKNPELAEKPEIAAKIAVWFWKQRVQPNVDNFNDVRAVTKPINPGLNGLDDRKEAFVDFKKFKLASR